MRNNNYITGCGWMFNDLGLKGNDAWIFALIYGFAQDGKSEFEGSLSYIEDTLNLSRNTVISILDKLQTKQLINKRQVVKNKVVYNNYSLGSAFFALGSAEIDKGVVQKLTKGSAKTAPHITIHNTSKDIYKKASLFLQESYPSRFESEFEMRFKKQFNCDADYKSFLEDFDLTWDGKEYPKNLFGELVKYAKNKVRFIKTNQTMPGVVSMTADHTKKILSDAI